MTGKIVALCGGVGGAKLALGLSRVVPPEDLTIVVNTGDDFEHLGLHVSPDVDTVLYTLAGLANRAQGWGLEGETWHFMAALRRLGGADWFNLGDADLATHVERTRRLAAGDTLSAITADFATKLGVAPTIVPMSDAPVRTVVETAEGALAFQDYFVRLRCEPAVKALRYEGADAAAPAARALQALADPALAAVIVCPSNPWLSIAPLLAMPRLADAIGRSGRPVIAVSPLVGGKAVKGPTAKLMAELGHPVTAQAVAGFYGTWLTGFLLDATHDGEAEAIRAEGLAVETADTLMTDDPAKERLARAVLAFGERLAAR